MRRHFVTTNSGFTFIEILICVVILMILWLAPLDIFFRNTYGATYSRHIAQASYAAKEIIEELRMYPFGSVVARGLTTTVHYPDIQYRIIILSSGTNWKRVQIEMSWKEKAFGSEKEMKQYFTTDIANDPILK